MHGTLTDVGGQSTAVATSETRGPRLTSMLRVRTHVLHRQAEKSGVIAALLRQQSSRHAYASYVRNLLPAYVEMECGLERHKNSPVLGSIDFSPLYRVEALTGDPREHLWLEMAPGAGAP